MKALLATALLLCASSITLAASPGPAPATLQAQLQEIQTDWARTNYLTDSQDRKAAEFEALAARASAFERSFPGRAEPLIWHGIVLSSLAGAKGGLGALSIAKQARAKLEAALKLDPAALEGSAYTSLGTLYYKVPGFPIGFGNDDKARELLQTALKHNPEGIDPNYFYGEFLLEDGDYAAAVRTLRKALAAPARPNRELADQGRRREIEALLATAQQKLN